MSVWPTTARLVGTDGATASLVAEVVTLEVAPIPEGAIVRANGLPPTQGWWEAELVAQPVDENGVIHPTKGTADPRVRTRCQSNPATRRPSTSMACSLRGLHGWP